LSARSWAWGVGDHHDTLEDSCNDFKEGTESKDSIKFYDDVTFKYYCVEYQVGRADCAESNDNIRFNDDVTFEYCVEDQVGRAPIAASSRLILSSSVPLNLILQCSQSQIQNGWSLPFMKPKQNNLLSNCSVSAAFIRVFEDIHRAGVRHHDPRLENLMVNDNGRVAVIDFDKAELHASESSKEREMVYVKDILDGEYPNRDGWPSECTPQPSRYGDFRRGSSDSRSESE
jgi:serine/threonine protein kinase